MQKSDKGNLKVLQQKRELPRQTVGEQTAGGETESVPGAPSFWTVSHPAHKVTAATWSDLWCYTSHVGGEVRVLARPLGKTGASRWVSR
jgi:hypothetical protein